MKPELIDVMRDQVRTIYRAVTGAEVPEPLESTTRSDAPLEEVTRRFAELETLARGNPFVSELVPPFSFTPSLDAFCGTDQIVVELAVPGVDRSDLNVEMSDGMVVISGLRRASSDAGRLPFSHAEIPRGPFYREFRVPVPVQPDPNFTLERGLLRIQLKRTPNSHREGDGHPPDTSRQDSERGV